MMEKLDIVPGSEVDQSALEQFLHEVYSSHKSNFILEHGDWLYRGDRNQWIVIKDEQIVAYCAVIPTVCAVRGRRVPGLWWVDLVVAPDFRGQGIQSHIDEKMRQTTDLKLGFPNELAAKIHRKHNWGVREDGRVLLLPVRLSEINAVNRSSGPAGFLMKVAAPVLTIVLKVLTLHLRSYRPKAARTLGAVDAETIADVFERHKQSMPITTYRDPEHIRWRFLEAPYAEELVFYTGGPSTTPTHCLIVRYKPRGDTVVVRILDLFGDLSDAAGLRDVLQLAIRDAVCAGATQITAMSFLPELTQVLRRLGFVISTTGRFCWHSQAALSMQAFSGRCHWTLADSDNDELE